MLTTSDDTAQFSFPRPGTVKAAVLADILQGRRITHMDCWREHGSSRLSHHIHVLRRSGWPAHSNEIEAPTSDGRTARIALYSLPAETIAAAGERGMAFVAEVAAVPRRAA